MATDYGSSSVKCPFYITEDKNRIKCEGIVSGSRTVMEFSGKNKKEKMKERYCGGEYEKCMMYAAINSKYK